MLARRGYHRTATRAAPAKRDDATVRTRYFEAVASGQPSGDVSRRPGNRCATSALGSSTGISQSTYHRRRDWRAIGA